MVENHHPRSSGDILDILNASLIVSRLDSLFVLEELLAAWDIMEFEAGSIESKVFDVTPDILNLYVEGDCFPVL